MQPSAYLSFGIDETRYAIPASLVVEIVRAVAVDSLAGAPAIVKGVIDYRGSVVPVFDIAGRFRHGSRPVRAAHRMIIAATGKRTVCLHVDAVDSLAEISETSIEPAPTSIDASVPIAGVARTAEGLVVIQDLERFLSDAESSQLDAAMAGA